MAKSKILITGGNGDLAKELVKLCEDQTYEIDCPARDELDVSSVQSVNSYFFRKYYDVVVNMAGVLYSSSVVDSVSINWINSINVNLVGPYLVAKAAIAANSKVRIVNVASTAAFNTYAEWSSYCVSKAGLLSLSGCLSKEGVDVICLCPGAIDTKLRNGLNIINTNLMSRPEAVKPVLDAIKGVYKSGDVIFYRKGCFIINPTVGDQLF